jgi:hypothetical protein
MHLQQSTPGWHEALLALPDGAVCKAFDAGLLRDAKETWAAGGRDPARLITVFRHHDVYTAPEGTWADAVAHWRAMYPRSIDTTFYDRYAPFVDIVSESNEYTAWSTWTDPREATKATQNVAAAAYVWNTYYRGRNGIPADTRVALLASPVSNGWPRAITQIAVDTDNYLDYHAYELCVDGARVWDSWANHSGLWHRLEQEHGLKPLWLFGESGPYRDAVQGWRHPACLGGDEDKLVAVMTAWWADVATTPAYREGRIAGPGCWFTSGNVGWPYYQLDAGQLLKLAQACRAVWTPGRDIPMTPEDLLKIKVEAQSIIAICDKYLGHHSLAQMTNQAVINLFYEVFGAANYIHKLSVATDEWVVFNNRTALFVGPVIELMPGLSDADKRELVAAL